MCLFVFKQKTAYEMRISDWSSDVCSSDLPRNIVCMARNYMESGALAEPDPINAFHKAPNAVIGPDETMVLPDVAASNFECEAEIAVVIGKRASHVARSEEHTSELQSLMRISYAVFRLHKTTKYTNYS